MSIYKRESSLLAVPGGILRLQNSDAIKQQMLDLMIDGVQDFYLYMMNLMEVDSAGLGVLVGLHITARKRKINFSLISPTAFQMKLFEATRLNMVFSLISGVEAENIWLKLAREENVLPPDAANPAS